MALGKKKSLHQAAGTAVVNTENFALKLYTGNSSTQSITGLGFEPDLVYIKCKTDTFAPVMFDTVRGTTKALWTSENYAQQNDADTITSFDSDGFTTGDDNKTNRSSETYIAWCWKAGGTAVTGTSSNNHLTNIEESANPTAGFSIIKYTSNGTTGAKFNHGLNSAPELYIIKETTAADDWMVVAKIGSSYQRAKLNTADVFSTAMSGVTNNVDPTNTEITLGNSSSVNANNNDYIAYCFHSVDGYQKIGSYTGTGNTSNSITGVGFQPRFVMLKRTNSTGGWEIYDSSRGEHKVLQAEGNYAEYNYSTTGLTSFDSDGFTVEGTGTNYNASGSTYIYLAIA